MNLSIRTSPITISGLLVALILASVILSGPVTRLEDGVLDLRYALRGEIPADTNVAILYFDNDDIASLGGWPLARNYYALLIDVLTKSGVAAIGMDIFFGEQHLQFPEHDDLLASTIAGSGRVVLSSYFRQLDANPLPLSDTPLFANDYLSRPVVGFYGDHLQLPFDRLARSAAGIGHANLIDRMPNEIPLYVRFGTRAIPAFAAELLRVSASLPRDRVRLEEGAMVFGSAGGDRPVPYSRDGTISLNFPGSIASFAHYRCVEVMRSSEVRKMGVQAPIKLETLRGKIILIGVIGEGRSRFVQTPFDQRFASLALHATVVDNALRQRALERPGLPATSLIAVVLALLSVYLIVRFGYLRGAALAFCGGAVYAVGSQLFFSSSYVVLPIVLPFILIVSVSFGAVMYEFFIARKKVTQLESDKGHIEDQLRERELKLQLLEREMLDQKSKEGPDRGAELLEEIKRYKQDIKRLSAQASDLVKFEVTEGEAQARIVFFEGIVYQNSGKMKEMVDLLMKIAGSNANVLILGESGTGKELVARAIHNLSNRKARQFVAVNCGALTETLLESELFGHEKGSFTGAIKEKIGRFEHADGGTIFLDEIAETSEAFQVKLLRVVQAGEFERVGSSSTRRVDIRIIAATNRNVKDLVDAKKFREDLYYRLNVFTVQLPPLRERKGDIPALAEHFLRSEGQLLSLSSTVIDAFLQYQWPGNVRELESTIKRAAILATSERRELIQLKDLSAEIVSSMRNRLDIEDQILELLRFKKFSRSSISETAEELGGLNRGTVAEYFRGICFKYFFESVWNKEQTALTIAGDANSEATDKVRKKISEYLGNVVEGLERGGRYDEVKPSLKAKYKNLPQRYHTILDEVIRAFLSGKWN